MPQDVNMDAHPTDEGETVVRGFIPADRPPEITDVAWKRPDGWIWPAWLQFERVPASLPMSKERLVWCLDAIGWTLEQLANRVHIQEGTVRQMGRGRKPIPDELAFYVEHMAKLVLDTPAPVIQPPAKPV
jgi:hypothetical protein